MEVNEGLILLVVELVGGRGLLTTIFEIEPPLLSQMSSVELRRKLTLKLATPQLK
jgi:hypothetical protein